MTIALPNVNPDASALPPTQPVIVIGAFAAFVVAGELV